MRFFSILSLVILLGACKSENTATYKSPDISVSGEFLFEGPNTLQGPSPINLDLIAKEVGVSAEEIKSVFVSGATISFKPDSLRSTVESALVQWVSDDLPLVSVATKSPLPDEESVSLEVNGEEDILKYLKDKTSTIIVDANLSKDADSLEGTVSFQLNIVY